jgi:hypothetical protein
MALNFGTYRLLPMFHRSAGPQRFEFFGHGIVELARLTTGKSSREVDEIAEFLIHAGYDSRKVDSFLAPLVEARRGHAAAASRPYTAAIDGRGELVNEGIVLTASFLAELERDIEGTPVGTLNFDDVEWLAFALEPPNPDTLYVGLRLLGVARLKGLAPQELIEATVWEALPATQRPKGTARDLMRLLRQLGSAEAENVESVAANEVAIPEELLVVTYLGEDRRRLWVFGHYRHSDDMVLHAVDLPINTPELGREEPLETWLFRNRYELAQLYEGVRRSNPGSSRPLSTLRRFDGFMACFLAFPHRAPGQR